MVVLICTLVVSILQYHKLVHVYQGVVQWYVRTYTHVLPWYTGVPWYHMVLEYCHTIWYVLEYQYGTKIGTFLR